MCVTKQRECDAILESVADFPSGASSKDIRVALKWPVSRVRTMQRHLLSLVQENRLIVEGASRTRRYRLPPKNDRSGEFAMVVVQENGFEIPLSVESRAIREIVLKPAHLRLPVGYNREFLDQYRPNNTYYLSDNIRRHLLEIGGARGSLPAGTYARQIFNRLLIDLSWNSSRLEGNTYSLLETERLLKLSEIVEEKDLKETQMILNHKDAIEFLVDSAGDIGINTLTILNLHAILSQDLLGDPEACGRLRSILRVGIGQSVYNPSGVPQLIEECFQRIIDIASKIQDPFEQAFF